MANWIRTLGQSVVRVLAVRTAEEREKRDAHAIALLLVSAIAIVKYVSGVTGYDTRFTLYGLAIALSAGHGGFAPALVATLASILVAGAPPSSVAHARLLFAIEGISIALVVSAIRSRFFERRAMLLAADARVTELMARDRHRRAQGAALRVARRRQWDDYREAAARAQAALQQTADDTRRQLSALESLIDPSLNPFEGPAMVTELLERLRATVGADGAALVQPGRIGETVIAARGLQPAAGSGRNGAEAFRLAPGRVALVHNDPQQVERLSALDWPPDVTSLMIVPVVHNGRVWSTIEVATERTHRATDWDIALVRVAADRLAAVVSTSPSSGSPSRPPGPTQ